MLRFNENPKMEETKDEPEISEWEKEFNEKSAHWGLIWWREMEDVDLKDAKPIDM